ncbi:MAG: addiction module protein, partial [Vicinamibacterales bacterium]
MAAEVENGHRQGKSNPRHDEAVGVRAQPFPGLVTLCIVSIMTELPRIDELLALPVNRRLELMEALWDSLSAAPELDPMPDWHREVLAQRLAEDDT